MVLNVNFIKVPLSFLTFTAIFNTKHQRNSFALYSYDMICGTLMTHNLTWSWGGEILTLDKTSLLTTKRSTELISERMLDTEPLVTIRAKAGICPALSAPWNIKMWKCYSLHHQYITLYSRLFPSYNTGQHFSGGKNVQQVGGNSLLSARSWKNFPMACITVQHTRGYKWINITQLPWQRTYQCW